MPKHKNLEQSNMQQEIEIVKVKQQKKMPEQPKTVTRQDIMDFMAEQFRKQEETSRKQIERLDKMREDNQRHHEKFMKRMDECFKNMNKTLDSTSEGIKVSPNTEKSSKEIEIRVDQNALLSENS